MVIVLYVFYYYPTFKAHVIIVIVVVFAIVIATTTATVIIPFYFRLAITLSVITLLRFTARNFFPFSNTCVLLQYITILRLQPCLIYGSLKKKKKSHIEYCMELDENKIEKRQMLYVMTTPAVKRALSRCLKTHSTRINIYRWNERKAPCTCPYYSTLLWIRWMCKQKTCITLFTYRKSSYKHMCVCLVNG